MTELPVYECHTNVTGRLPAGAVVGRNGYGRKGYSICPPGKGAEEYVFALFALPKPLSPRPGFEPLALRKQALHSAHNQGLLVASYTGA